MNIKKTLILIITLLAVTSLQATVAIETAVDYPSSTIPGKAKSSNFFDDYKLYNNVLEFAFKTSNNSLKPLRFKNKHDAAVFDLTNGSLFAITIGDGLRLTPDDFQLVTKPQIKKISSRCDSVVLAGRFAGKKIVIPLISKNGQIAIEWVLSLRDGSNYITQEITIKAISKNLPISKIQMLDFPAQGSKTVGVLAGCPIVAGNIFLGYENPNAWAKIYDPAAPVNLALNKNITCTNETDDGLAKDAVNGDISTKNYWKPKTIPADIIIDLGKEFLIDKINLHLAYNFNLTYYWFKEWVYEYKVETSTDSQNWNKVAEKNNDKIAMFEPDELIFAPIKSRFVKVTLLKHNMDGVNNAGLRQIEIFSSAEDNARIAKLSKEQKKPRIQATLNRNSELLADSEIKQSAVFGVVPEGQLRRGFLYYIERQRAHPYRGFLHYNSFYDIVLKNESDCVQRISKIGDEITKKHNTILQSYAFDDGWDNSQTLWQFHTGFPDGFENMKTEAAKYNSALGVWMSPSGGYGPDRIKYAKSKGYKTNKNGISMADKNYYQAFLSCCSDMMTKYNVNYFKFDRLGEGLHTFGGTADYTEDVEATLRLMQDMRKIKPDVFINLTVGAWASPYLLFYCDSLWRDGGDSDFFGQGSKRELWITYRDCQTYRNIVKRSPLYPVTSLMTCGIINGQLYQVIPTAGDDFIHETRSFFANGTNCQELYITPERMTDQHYQAIEEGAKFARANEMLLADSHWIGGDPGKAEIYGWASWSKNQGIIALRNPSDKIAEISIDIQTAFELPQNAPKQYTLKCPFKEDQNAAPLQLKAGEKHTFELSPFEVIVLKTTAIK